MRKMKKMKEMKKTSAEVAPLERLAAATALQDASARSQIPTTATTAVAIMTDTERSSASVVVVENRIAEPPATATAACSRPPSSRHCPKKSWRANVAQVTWSLLLVLRSACVSVVFAWLAMLCFSTGNIFSGHAPQAQSTRAFGASMIVWAKALSWLSVAAIYAVSLATQRFVSRPDARPAFITCWLKVLKGTTLFAAVSTCVVVAITVALLHVPASVRELRLHFYATAFWYHLEATACNIESTRIFDDETVRGHEKQRASLSTSPSPHHHDHDHHHRRQRRRHVSYWKQLARVYCRTFSSVASYVAIALYAHITSSVHLVTASQLLVFMVASFAIKNGLQEIARCFVFQQRVQNLSVMAVTVGIPTIFIDTQMRIVLLRAKSTSATLAGTLVMAVVEIVLRIAKSFYVRFEIAREQTRRAAMAASLSNVRNDDSAASVYASSRNESDLSSTPSTPPSDKAETPGETPETAAEAGRALKKHESFDKWRQRLLHFHAAKVYIDVVAEYVALGCSYVILLVCWNHPQFMLRRFHDDDARDSSSSASHDHDHNDDSLSAVLGGSQAMLMVSQLGTELVVDFASCLLEVGNGIDFRPVQRQSFFLVVFLVWAAMGNITIAANMFVLM